MTRPGKVVICGGGIAGACAGLALQARGMEAVVLEKRDRHDALGAGIQLAPNATRLLRGLGVEMRGRVLHPVAIEIRDGISNQLAYRVPLGESLEQRYGAPYWILNRGDLLDALWQRLEASNILSMRQEVTGFEMKEDGVVVHCADGREIKSDYLIGADGVHSKIRQQAFPEIHEPRYSGHVAWRLQVEQDGEAIVPKNKVSVWCGRGRHLVAYPLPDKRVNIVAIAEQEQQHTSDVMDVFADWHVAKHWLQSLAGETWKRWHLLERKVPAIWSRGRVGLLGDACHPMLPFLAQGAAMAIEDAVALAKSLEKGNGLQGLHAPHRVRRVRRLHREIALQTRFFHRHGVAGQLAWHAAATSIGRIFPERLRDVRLGWLYGAAEL